MAVKEIPLHYIVSCDCCGVETTQKSKGRPSGWAVLTFEQAAVDYQGAEVADATVKIVLCPECRPKIAMVISDARAALAKAKESTK